MADTNTELAQRHYIEGSEQYFAKQFQEAIDTLSKAIELNPQHYEAYDRRGSVYKKLGRFDQALHDFNQALAIDPTFHRAYRNRGHVLRDINLPISALADFEASQRYVKDEKKKDLVAMYIKEVKKDI